MSSRTLWVHSDCQVGTRRSRHVKTGYEGKKQITRDSEIQMWGVDPSSQICDTAWANLVIPDSGAPSSEAL